MNTTINACKSFPLAEKLKNPIIHEYFINDDKVSFDEFIRIEKELQEKDYYHQNSTALRIDYKGVSGLWTTCIRTISHNEDLKCGNIS